MTSLFGMSAKIIAGIGALTFLSVSVWAKEVPKKRTAVSFEDQLIEGEINKPEFFYFLQKKQFNFGRLIKLRENFLLEMRKTAEETERRGGT